MKEKHGKLVLAVEMLVDYVRKTWQIILVHAVEASSEILSYHPWMRRNQTYRGSMTIRQLQGVIDYEHISLVLPPSNY